VTQRSDDVALVGSVADPDPYVFGPPGSGSVSQRYGPGSGSFYHRRKTLIPSVLRLCIFEKR
jgi:hypothetical protein